MHLTWDLSTWDLTSGGALLLFILILLCVCIATQTTDCYWSEESSLIGSHYSRYKRNRGSVKSLGQTHLLNILFEQQEPLTEPEHIAQYFFKYWTNGLRKDLRLTTYA